MTKLLLVLLPAVLWGALPPASIIEIRHNATASNVNGAGFNTGHASFIADFAASNANTSAPVIASASYNFVAGDVDAWAYIQTTGGGGVWYASRFCKISSVASNQATLAAGAGACIELVNNHWDPTSTAGIASTASPTGGVIGFDFTQQAASEVGAADGASVTTSTTFSSATAGFRTIMRGNFLRVSTTGGGATCVVGWYHIESVTSATAVVLDRAPSAAAGCTTTTFAVGGAASLPDDAILELASVSTATAAFRYFLLGGAGSTYTLAGSIALLADGNAAWPIVMEEYLTLRGDRPAIANQAAIIAGASTISMGSNWEQRNVTIFGTGTTLLTMGANGKLIKCKVVNTSVTAARPALSLNTETLVVNNEIQSYRGRAISGATVVARLVGNYIHDSDVGVYLTSSTSKIIAFGNVFSGNVTSAVNYTVGNTGGQFWSNNTFHGATNKLGIGILMASGTTVQMLLNNIITGFVTGVSHADTQTAGYDNYNAYYNNTADISAAGQWQKGVQDSALDPQFVGVTQITDATYTTGSCGAADNLLTVSGANFTSAGVVAGRDFVYISGVGTNGTVGVYGIVTVGTTTLTLDLDCSSTSTASALPWQITMGRNFGIGTNLRALGFPGEFPGGYSTGAIAPGAVQRTETGGAVVPRVSGWIQ